MFELGRVGHQRGEAALDLEPERVAIGRGVNDDATDQRAYQRNRLAIPLLASAQRRMDVGNLSPAGSAPGSATLTPPPSGRARSPHSVVCFSDARHSAPREPPSSCSPNKAGTERGSPRLVGTGCPPGVLGFEPVIALAAPTTPWSANATGFLFPLEASAVEPVLVRRLRNEGQCRDGQVPRCGSVFSYFHSGSCAFLVCAAAAALPFAVASACCMRPRSAYRRNFLMATQHTRSLTADFKQ